MTWDEYGLTLARVASHKSKDPNTQVGCCLLGPWHETLSTGYNGPPRGVPDDPDMLVHRETKLKITLHAELNAVLTARESLRGATCYVWPFSPCAQCAAVLAQVGIARVVAPPPPPDLVARWERDLELAQWIFDHAGIDLNILDIKVPTS